MKFDCHIGASGNMDLLDVCLISSFVLFGMEPNCKIAGATNVNYLIPCPIVFLRRSAQSTIAICVPVQYSTAVNTFLCTILSKFDLQVGVCHLDIVDRAVIHGDGQLFLSIKGNQRCQQPIAVSLLRHSHQIIIGKGHVRHIRHAQGHLQLIEQLRQQDAGLAGDGELHTLIIKIHRKSGKGREAGGGEGDTAILGHRGIDIICLAVVTDVDDQHLRILVQLHAGNGHFHSNRGGKGLPVAAIVILHRNIPHEQLAGTGITFSISQQLFNCSRRGRGAGGASLHHLRHSHTATDRNAADADDRALHLGGSAAAQVGIEHALQIGQLVLVVPVQILQDVALGIFGEDFPILVDLRCVLTAKGRIVPLQCAGVGMVHHIRVHTAVTSGKLLLVRCILHDGRGSFLFRIGAEIVDRGSVANVDVIRTDGGIPGCVNRRHRVGHQHGQTKHDCQKSLHHFQPPDIKTGIMLVCFTFLGIFPDTNTNTVYTPLQRIAIH